MSKKGYSQPDAFGGYTHYDGNGKKIGRSEPGFFGEYKHYDARGRSTGHSDPGFLGGYNHYDSRNRRTGRSDPGFFGSYNHYDSRGHRTGSSDPGFFGGYNHNEDTGGCYVATCVYGSYDCPQVWTLRRFRDNILAEYVIGRMFIRTYYAISPTIVRLFGQTAWFRTFWRKHLDHLVHRLQREGVEDTPYRDKIW
jgi:hypothetical protein